MVDLNKLTKPALAAAMKGGTAEWGQRASSVEHVRYAEPQTARKGHYRKCHCGCAAKAKWRGMANGICLTEGCELSMRRWARNRKPLTVSIRMNIADAFWIAATPVRFACNVAVLLIGGLYFGILAIVPLWRESQEKHRIWSAVRRQNDIRA